MEYTLIMPPAAGQRAAGTQPGMVDDVHQMPIGTTWLVGTRLRIERVEWWGEETAGFQLSLRVRGWWGGYSWKAVCESTGYQCQTFAELYTELNWQRAFQRNVRRYSVRYRKALRQTINDHAYVSRLSSQQPLYRN